MSSNWRDCCCCCCCSSLGVKLGQMCRNSGSLHLVRVQRRPAGERNSSAGQSTLFHLNRAAATCANRSGPRSGARSGSRKLAARSSECDEVDDAHPIETDSLRGCISRRAAAVRPSNQEFASLHAARTTADQQERFVAAAAKSNVSASETIFASLFVSPTSARLA